MKIPKIDEFAKYSNKSHFKNLKSELLQYKSYSDIIIEF